MTTKLALICDTHYGIRGDNIAFLDANKKFLDNVFFPTLEAQGIKHLIHLGDLVDKRKTLNVNTANRLHADFLQRLEDLKINTTIIAGNHDCYHKTTNEVNALSLLLHEYEYLCYLTRVEDTGDCLFVPWICDDNREETLAAIKKSKAKYCFGHLELVGYQMYKGVINEHGDSKDLFGHIGRVFTGHFHHKSRDGNIDYLGSHGQFTWSDYNDPRGFHILDEASGELEFIRNPYDMFLKVGYDDSSTNCVFDMATGEHLEPDMVTDKYVKVVVRQKANNASFDKLVASIQELRPLDIQILDEAFNTDTDRPNIILETQDTLTIFKNHIDTLEDMDVPKADLERLFIKLYQQASEVV